MKQAGRAPLLNKGQEIQLARQIRAWLDSSDPDARTIKKGQRARRKMIECNMRLAIHVAKKYQRRVASNTAVSFDDLIQEATLGLNRAAEKFDPERGYAFSTYATLWCKQACGRLCDTTSSTVKITPPLHQLAMKWRYRPEGMTLDEFAAERGLSPAKVKQRLELWNRAQCSSLDCRTNDGDERSSALVERIAADEPIEDDQDYAAILDGLKHLDGGVLRESLALLELAEETKPAELAELIDCSARDVQGKLRNARAQIREHCPEHVRAMILGPERQIEPVKIKPVPASKPARELVVAGHHSLTPHSMSESIAAPSSNGHGQTLEHEAMEVIAEVRAEAPKQRRRRTKAEIAAEETVKLSVNGLAMEGSASDIAAVLKAYC